MPTDRKLRVAVDCRMANNQQGVGTAVIALAKALSDARDGHQEYTFIVHEEMRDWLAPYVYGPCTIVGIPPSQMSKAKGALRAVAPLRFIWHKWGKSISHTPASDGYVEAQRYDVVHFPTQFGYLTDIPSIYQPWDLQHVHYPEFFTQSEYEKRERYYRALCDRASYVCVQAEWTRRDVIEHFGLSADKVVVIPWASVFDAYAAPSAEGVHAAVRKYNLPKEFFFYPAATWPHKNHEVILHALHILKKEYGLVAPVYFSGSSQGHRAELDRLAAEFGVVEQVSFLGFLSPGELQAVFSSATAMIFASKFEGFGLPILEAFHARLPVICSNATTLPEVAGDAALYFAPDSPEVLASLMKTVLDSPRTRANLIEKGALLLSRHSIGKMAADFCALYDRTASIRNRKPGVSEVSAAN